MQKLKSLLIFLTIGVAGVSQQKIDGIGPFKINKSTTSLIGQLSTELNRSIKIVDNYDDEEMYKDAADVILDLRPNKAGTESYESPNNAAFCSAARNYLIPDYTIAGITLKNIILKFYNDTLVDVTIDYSTEIVDALETKYSKPVVERKVKEVACIYKLTGNKVSNKEYTYTYTWKNRDIECVAALNKYYSDKCEERFFSYINISSTRSTKLYKCNEQARERRFGPRKLGKEALKDF